MVDDNHFAACGMRRLLLGESSIAEVRLAADLPTALAEARGSRPDLLLVDVLAEQGSGVRICRAVLEASPGTPGVLVTTDRRPSHASLRAAGARAYVCKSWDERHLVSAVRAGGVRLFPSPASVSLSPRERDVLRLIATGLTTAGIGAALGISAETVKHHCARLRQKLGAPNRASAVALADAAGLLG